MTDQVDGRASRRAWLAAAAGLGAALPAAVALRGFTVDDAFITARYAAHIASGIGYRFNPGGPVTDGVTPLGWAYVLAPLAGEGPLAAWRAAKWLGMAAWLVSAALLGITIDRLPVRSRAKWLALSLVAVSAPLGAWSAAGMETGVVMALAGAAACARALGRERRAAVGAGIVAGLRPEMLPWALVLALAPPRQPLAPAGERGRRAFNLLAAGAPFVLAACTRLWVFGRALPLAALAKPSDWAHGWRYALACALLCGPIAIVAWRKLPGWVRGLQAATAAHFVALALAGGDWMPLSRLAVTALPTMVLAAAFIVGTAPRALGLARLGLALLGPIYVAATVGPRAARVGEKRLAVLEQLAPALATSRVVAALDVGWVGAACGATIVNLAGVTDPAGIAALPGGHTSKRISPALIAARRVDTLVLLLGSDEALGEPWTESRFARWVELDIAAMPAMAERFRPVVASDLPLRYAVLREGAD